MKIDYELLLLKSSGFTGGPCMNINLWFNTYSCEYVWEIWCLVTKIYR